MVRSSTSHQSSSPAGVAALELLEPPLSGSIAKHFEGRGEKYGSVSAISSTVCVATSLHVFFFFFTVTLLSTSMSLYSDSRRPHGFKSMLNKNFWLHRRTKKSQAFMTSRAADVADVAGSFGD